jgi:hypothetical protein
VKRRFLGIILITVLVLGVFTQGSEQNSRIFPFSQIKPGMKGLGKTVVKGDEIRTFDVTVVDVIDNIGVLNDHIVVRLDGAAIRQSGGVAAGMSGSPIYINNKLAGALWGAWGFQVGAQPIALIRPIETMLTLVSALKMKEQDRLQRGAFVPHGSIGAITLDGERKQIEIVSERPRELRPDTIFVEPAATPLLVSGLSGRAIQWLRAGASERAIRSANNNALLSLRQGDFLDEITQGLEERYDMKVRPTGLSGAAARASYYKKDPIPIVEGGPLGVMLTDGDITLGAFGTVSYVEEQIVLAFGHWFFPAGETEFFLTEAFILDTVEALDRPFKLGVSGRTVGAIFEDRWQGVGGVAEVQPRSFDVNISVRDRDLKTSHNVSFRVAYYESLMPLLLLVSALETVDQTLNRVGPGTMITRYTIQGADLPRPLARTDVFASFSDIAVTGPLRVAQMLFFLARNEFADVRFSKVDIEIEAEQRVRALRVRALKTDKEKYKPGETVKYTVILKPYRGEEQTVEGNLKLPEALDRSSLTLLAFGGPRRSERDNQEAPEFDSLEALVETLQNIPGNNELTVEFSGLADEETKESEEQSGELRRLERLGEVVVYGERTHEIKIELGKPEEPKPEDPKPEPKKKPCKYLFYCP